MEYYVNKNKSNNDDYYKRVVEEEKKKYATDLSTVSVNSFLDKANKYFSSADKSLRSTGYSTASKNAEDRRKQAQELRMEALGVDRYLDINKSSMDENTYKTLKQYVSEIGYETAKVTDAFDTAEDYYSQFSDREKFNDYRENIRQNAWLDKYQNKNYTDLNILASKMEDGDEKNWVKRYATSKYTPEEGYMEVSRLENVLDEYNRLLKGNVNDPKNQERLRDITSRYGGKDDLEALISQTRQRNTEYDRELERQKLTSVGDRESANYDPEFDYWAKSRTAVPTRQDIENYDIMMDNSTWQVGDDGRMYDAFGNEIDTSKRDANGKVIHPAAGSVNTSDRLGIYLAAKNDTTDYSVAERAWGTVDQILAEGDSRHWDRLSEDQINTYYYYLNKQGADAANRYLDLIQNTVNKELGEEQASQVPDSDALKALFGIKAGIEQFEAGMGGFGRQIRGESDYVAPSAEQYAAAMVRKDLDGLWGVAYDTASTVANMAPSVLVGTLANAFVPGAGFVGSLVMGAGASGNAYDQMINEGYTVDQARTYGALVGVSEVALERLLGGISEFGGSTLSKGLQKAMTAADNALLKVAVNAGDTAIGRILSNMISEGTEEGLQEILGTWLKNLITHSEENVNWEEVAYSTLLGALTGGVFEGVSVGANALQTNAVRKDVGKTIMAADGGVDALKALALDVSGAGSKLVNQAEKVTGETAVGKNFIGKVVAAAKNSANQKRIGKLYEGVRSEVSAQNRSDIAKLLGEKGFSSTSAKNIAEAIAARINGDETNKFQDMVLDEVKDNSAVNEIVKTVLTDEASMVSKRTTDLDLYSRGVAAGKGIAPTKTERPDYDVSEDGKTILHNADGTAREVEVKRVSNIENGKVKLELNDGTVVDADQVSFASTGEAWTYSVLAEIGATAEEANDILSFYEGSTDIDRVAYARGVQEAYRYGTIGVPAGQISQTGFAARMSESAMKYAYNVGRKQSVIKAGQAQNKLANRVIGKGQYYNNFTQERNGVHYDDVDITTEKLNARQKTGIQMAEFLAAIGMNVHVYKSEKVNGQYVGDNGTYYGKDGSIHIDLMSGSSGQGYVGYTISHEFTHFIKDWSPEKFKVFADALFEEMGKSEVEVNKMVATTLARIKTMKEYKNKTEDQLWDIAYDEVVAEMCETMLTDTDAAVRIAENLKNTDSELLNKIIEFFNNLLAKLKDVLKINVAYKDSAPDSYIARQARETIQKVERLRDLYAEAAAGAVQSFNAAKENTSEYAESSMSNEEAFEDSEYAVLNQIRPPYSDGSKAFNTFTENLDADAKKTFDLFYGFYQKSRITNTMSVTGKRVKAVNISSLYLLAQDWNDMLAKEPKWANAAKELADFLPADVRKRMNMNEDGTLNPTMLEKEFKMPSSMAQRLVDALPVEAIEATYRMGNKEITLPEGKARQSVGGEAYRRAIIDETRKLFAEGKLKQVSIGTMSKDRWGSLGFLAANGKTGASGDFTTVCPQMMFNRGCWYCYRRAAMEKGVNNKLVAQSVWYTGEILRIKDSDITALNRNGGLRIQSFGDWMPHFSAMLADVLYDAEQRGLQVKIITKEPSMINYIAALREQGVGKNLYFNLSADYTIERGPAKQAMTADSLDAVNPERPFMRYDNSYWWKRAMTVEEAAKYREKYPWVNVRIVATTQEEFIRGLKDPKVDVVTGYHGNIREYERVDSATGEHKVQVEALGDAGMPRFAFNPMTNSWTTEYEGKTSTHKKLAEAIAANNLQMEYYTKTCCITGRCATCQGKCGALARDFNVKNATNRDAESVAYWQREMQYGIEPEFGDMTTQGEVRRDSRYKYWKPNMPPKDVAAIQSLINYEAKTTDNYLGIDAKWLYNRQKGREYFALYSTADEQGPTMLYAIKGAAATYEYEWLMQVIEKEAKIDGYYYSGARTLAGVLDRVKNAPYKQTGNSSTTARSGGNAGNAALHSRNGRNRLSAAFQNCIKNIDEVQSSYGLDDHYQFAVDRGDLETAQRMVNEAAMAAGYAIKAYHGTPIKGITVFDDSKIGSTTDEGIFGRGFYFTTHKLTADGYATDDGKTMPVFLRVNKPWWGLGHKVQEVAEQLGLDESVLTVRKVGKRSSVVAPLTKFASTFSSKLIENGYDSVIVQHGKHDYEVVVFDNTRIKSADPVTYDDDGNVIPLSKRFDATNNDIRYSTRDSEGNELTEDQREYFENSMVRDSDGRLQVVYHGGTVKFEFDTSRGKAGTTEFGPGAYFTESDFIAKQYSWARGGNVKKYYLNIEKMFDDTDMAKTTQLPQWQELEKIIRRNGIEDKYIKQFREYGFGYMRRYLAIKAGDRKSDNWAGSEQLNAMLREAGFDGVKGPINDSIQYVIFTPNQAKLTTNEVPSAFYDTRYSSRVKVDTTGMDEDAKKIIRKLEIRATGSKYDEGQYASYSAERMEREIYNSSSATRMDYAKSYIAWVNPDDFLYATTTSDQVRAKIEEEAGELDLERLRKETQPIHLTVDFETGDIKGHEGRHRLTALSKAGVEKVAVIFDAWNDDRYNTKPISMMKINGQVFDRYHYGHGFYAHDMLPISKRYADAVRQLFSDVDGSVRFSERTEDSVSNRSLLANALESTTQHEVEKTRLQEYKDKIAAMDAEEQKLSDINAQIKEISFGQGPRDTKKLSKLQQEKTKIQNRINTYDKQLLRLESTKVLQNVLAREKQKAYKRAEARGQEALEAYKKAADKRYENFVNKQEEKRKNAVEARKRTEIRHKIQRVVNELNDLLLNESKTRHVPDSLKKAVAGALSILNMDTVAAEERAAKYAALIAKEKAKDEPDQEKIDAYTSTMENILRKGEKMGQKLKELKEAYEEIENSTDPDIALAYDPVIAGAIKELSQTIGDTSIMDMSIEQLSDVYDVYKMVLTRVRDANKAMAENIKATISQMASNVISEVRSAGGQHKMRVSMLDPVKKFFWNNMKPVYAMEYIGSSTLTHVFNNVRAGEDVWAKDVTEARAYYLDKAKKYGYNNWDLDKKYKFTSTSDLEFELTLEQMLSLYAYSKREQAHDHLRLGGFVFDSNIETTKEKNGIIKYKVNTADAHQISIEILTEIIGKLTSEQLGFVDEMQAYLSTTMGAKGNEVTSKMYGVKLFKEKNYFPLKSASQFMFEQNQVAGEVRIKNSGFTNKVVAKANNPIILSNFMDVWSNHVNDMSMYHAFTLPLEDFNRVFNFDSPKQEGIPAQSVKGTIQNAYTPAAVHYVKQLITDLNGGARTDPTTDIITKMMGLFKKGAVFASASVVIQQPSAIARAAALIDTKYFIGPKVDQKKHKVLWEELKKYAPVAIIKEMGYFDTHMGKSTQDFIQGKEYDGIKEQFKALFTDSDYRDELLSKAPALADELAWVGIWEAVKRETKAKYPGLDVKGEPFLKLAGSRFTEVITKTQVYDSVLSRSANMRSKDTGMKMATAFMAEPTTSINMITDALLKGKRGNKKYARKAIGSVIASMLLNSMLVAIVYAGRDDDEDKTYAEKYIESFLGSALDGLNPATYIPFIKDIVSIVQGYDVERSDMAVISDLWNAVQKLKSDKVSAWRKIEDFAGSIAQIFGLPVKNIMRDVRSVYQTLWPAKKQKTTAAGIGYAALSAVGKDVSDQEQLYRAFVNGNVEHLARVEGRYSTKKKANTAMRSAIKEHYLAGDITAETAMDYMVKYCDDKKDDAYWKIEEWNHEAKFEETFGKYDEFYGAVQTGKDLKATIKKYTDNGVTEETLRSQITDHFKEKYIKMTNAEKAAIKGYLLNAMTVLGNTRQEAEDKIKDWEFEATHGFSYNNRRQEYLEGDITKEQLEDALVNYGGLDEEEVEDYFSDTLFEAEYGFPYNHTGKLYKDGTLSRDEAFHIFTTQGEMSAEKANVKIAELDFEIEHGFSYSEKRDLFIKGDITAAELKQYIMSVEKKTEEEANSAIVSYVRDAYSDGEIDRTFAINTMTRYAGVEAEDAENKLRYIDVKQQYPDTYVDDAWVEEYYKEIESSGMSMDVFFEYRNQVKSITGKGKKENRLAVINSMPISTAQKDALYYAEGWAKSKIYEAPWH